MLKFNLIVAATEKLGIGKNGTFPWPSLKKEMAHFTKLTKGTAQLNSKKNIVIMGRKTWESIPAKFRPLPNRINFVLSTSKLDSEKAPDVYGFNSWDELYDKLNDEKFKEEYEQIWIIGGGGIYKHALKSKYFYRLYLTDIKQEFDCDVFFPTFSNLMEVSDPEVPAGIHEESGVQYEFKVYQNELFEECA
ncbi:hypothetical protein PPYR_01092 [Photinus pyralis]|uniref:dihydrofolate reductase n=1 Tax=Photinus pyralis TaxID=7054 RepID=A0A1Y1KVR6_PHOPY|nr:dihydrofolate reductase [Photinus pyralis]KAB0804122.1 hypothetical protein PPYR_01092 [Photinus pyralis]